MRTWTDQEALGRLVVIVLLITINAFFVAVEFAVVSVRRSRIQQLVASGDRQAADIQHLQEQIDRLLSTTQLGITFASLALGWLGESFVVAYIAPWLVGWWGSTYAPLAYSVAIVVTFILLAYGQIVVGELIPKSLALTHAEQVARLLSGPSRVVTQTLSPLVWVLHQSTHGLLGRLGLGGDRHSRHQMSSQELALVIATEQESQDLESHQRHILGKVFALSRVTVADVMVPKPQMQTVSAEATWREVVERVAATNFSRYPITGTTADTIIGTIHFRDLAQPLAAGRVSLDSPIAPYIRQPVLVPKSTSIDELLLQMQSAGTAMAIVADEYGVVVGLLTRKDAIAEILGKQKEDYPQVSPVSPQENGWFAVQGHISIAELNDTLGLNLPPSDRYQTLAGFLLYIWQHMPAEGAQYQYQDLEFLVARLEGARIALVHVRRLSPP